MTHSTILPEPRFRWVIVSAAALLLGIAMGTLVNGLSAFLLPLETHFGWARADVAAINSFGLIGFTANEIQPHKRPLSSMSPTLIFGKERVAALGTPGGSRIITMVLLGILDFLEGNGPESWVSLPRFHHQYLPDVVSAEPDAFTAEEIETLQAMVRQSLIIDNIGV